MFWDDKRFSSLAKWWDWAREHPTTVMVAALLLATLVLPSNREKVHTSADLDTDETPLFV